MLYAVLVEGLGPLGSVFTRDDFRDNEVQDTDGDGLLEFVDAWGEPLQFYRWPIFYYGQGLPAPTSFPSGSQRGYLPYLTLQDPRDKDPLDPNQQLIAPAWWSSGYNSTSGPFGGTAPLSGGAILFQQMFHSLTDPAVGNLGAINQPNAMLWDRGVTFYQRRAFYYRPLILSAGPDKTPGVMRLDAEFFNNLESYATGASGANPFPNGFPSGTLANDLLGLMLENQAASASPNRSSNVYYTIKTTASDAAANAATVEAGNDDITNQNIQAPGGAIVQ
jgi:hypothetical protein